MKHIRRYAAILTGLIGALAVFGAATPAFAMVPGSGGLGSPPRVVRTVLVGGTPGWQTAVIAIGSALVTGAAAVLADRARRRRLAVVPA